MKNSRNFFWTYSTYSEHEKILGKFRTNKTGQIPDIKNSGQIPANKTGQISDIYIVRKMFQKMIADQFSGQILDLDKFRTISGQITMFGNAHFLDHFPDNGNVRNLYS